MRDYNKPNQHLDNRYNLRLTGDDLVPYRRFSRLMGVDMSVVLRDVIHDGIPRVQAMIDAIDKFQEGDRAVGMEMVNALLAAAHVEIDDAARGVLAASLEGDSSLKTA